MTKHPRVAVVNNRTRGGMRIPDANAHKGELVDYPLEFAWDPDAADVRLSYLDPRQSDWMWGVLWARHRQDRKGGHTWKVINALRQRHAMLHHLCMVCSQPAADRGRIWWLFHTDPEMVLGRPERITNIPPTCMECIPEALSTCPPLKRRSRVCTAAGSAPFGVTVDLYAPGDSGATAVPMAREVSVPFGQAEVLRFALAKQLWVALHDLRDETFLP